MENKELQAKIEEKLENNIAMSWLIESLPKAVTGLTPVEGFEYSIKLWREFRESEAYARYWETLEPKKGERELLNRLFGLFMEYVSVIHKGRIKYDRIK